jgi:hypothetical protein
MTGAVVGHHDHPCPCACSSRLRPALRLTGPARPVIGLQGRRAARAAARGRRAAPDQSAAPARLGRPRRSRRADPAPADTTTSTPARHSRHRPALALPPAGFHNSATGADLGFYAIRSYSLIRPPRTGRRWTRSRERSATGWSGRGWGAGGCDAVAARCNGSGTRLRPSADAVRRK